MIDLIQYCFNRGLIQAKKDLKRKKDKKMCQNNAEDYKKQSFTEAKIKKHGKVMKWWLDNFSKGIWMKDNDVTGGWSLIHGTFFNEQNTYVQNDEFAEYRKALVDGKTVQIEHHRIIEFGGEIEEWCDITGIVPTSSFSKNKEYRIKPDEPKIKIGDWVVNVFNKFGVCQLHDYHNKSSYKKWQPKKGEMCVFYNDENCEDYVISKFLGYFVNKPMSDDDTTYKYVAPLEFVDTLKRLNERV